MSLLTAEPMPFTAVRKNLRSVIDEVTELGTECVITRHHLPEAVILSHDDYEGMIETMNILADPEAVAALERADAEFAAGEFADIDDLDV